MDFTISEKCSRFAKLRVRDRQKYAVLSPEYITLQTSFVIHMIIYLLKLTTKTLLFENNKISEIKHAAKEIVHGIIRREEPLQ